MNKPVAWRAWKNKIENPTPGNRWPNDQWVYWDEEPTEIKDDPEFSQFQALCIYEEHPADTVTTAADEAAREIRRLFFDDADAAEYPPPALWGYTPKSLEEEALAIIRKAVSPKAAQEDGK